MLKYLEYLHCVAGTLNQGPICGKTLSTDLKKACHGFLDCKKFRFSAGLLNGAVGRLRGAFYHRFYGGREGRMGTSKGRRREGRCYSEPKPRQLGRNAGVVFTTNSPKSICYANLHSSQSPIQPNQYANLLLCPMQGESCCPFVQVGCEAVCSRSEEGGDRHTCICSSWTLGWTMEIWPRVEEDAECTLVGAWGGRC